MSKLNDTSNLIDTIRDNADKGIINANDAIVSFLGDMAISLAMIADATVKEQEHEQTNKEKEAKESG